MFKQSFNVKQNKRIYLGVWESVRVILHSEWLKLHRALASLSGIWLDECVKVPCPNNLSM